ncbi:hypothetical protein BCR22_06755 [Enterococcus plantarum]|uniref:hypothetical protein n=1 Tax=Enterococcus TaxID=1350 RepID=UPI00084DADAA|nr:hypothetical protein [Enterococcus plantarum]OEG09292.1 hypothetical protein BCR22_06755 [Enterococcus plantarum]
MADIVQLEEKGNLLYPKTHVSAIDNFDETVVKKSGDEEIAGVKNFKDGLQISGKEVIKGYEKYTLKNTMINTEAKKNVSELAGVFVKTGNVVTFNGRVNISIANETSSFLEILSIPSNFLPNSTGYWNVAVTINQLSNAEATRISIIDGAKKSLLVYTNKTGNHYLSASWHT